ncbi:hypothetical protein [Spiroplasma endosymbiont of Aspidapion aeneum]|uniref:hypothetical protein n=1 Tax=Spiroplasma endosymbiont of Aspidapion aeneum TaxID=3066276 RepID=UPI00313C358E
MDIDAQNYLPRYKIENIKKLANNNYFLNCKATKKSVDMHIYLNGLESTKKWVLSRWNISEDLEYLYYIKFFVKINIKEIGNWVLNYKDWDNLLNDELIMLLKIRFYLTCFNKESFNQQKNEILYLISIADNHKLNFKRICNIVNDIYNDGDFKGKLYMLINNLIDKYKDANKVAKELGYSPIYINEFLLSQKEKYNKQTIIDDNDELIRFIFKYWEDGTEIETLSERLAVIFKRKLKIDVVVDDLMSTILKIFHQYSNLNNDEKQRFFTVKKDSNIIFINKKVVLEKGYDCD